MKTNSKQFFAAFAKAAIKGGYIKTSVFGTMFEPWCFGGMHDADPYNKKVIKRTEFHNRSRSNQQAETIQLDLLQYSDGKKQAAVFVRIHGAKKTKARNTATCTLNGNRLTDKNEFFVEFAGEGIEGRKFRLPYRWIKDYGFTRTR